MDAKAKAIAALEKAGFVPWFEEDSFFRKYPSGTSIAAVGETRTSVTFIVPHEEVSSLFPPSLSPEETQRLKEIRKRRATSATHAAEEISRRVYESDVDELLSLVDRLIGGEGA